MQFLIFFDLLCVLSLVLFPQREDVVYPAVEIQLQFKFLLVQILQLQLQFHLLLVGRRVQFIDLCRKFPLPIGLLL